LICPKLNASLAIKWDTMLKTADSRRKGKGKHHASTVEEGGSDKKASESPERQENIKEYYLVSALPGHITPDRNSWLVDSGVSKHMTGYKTSFQISGRRLVQCRYNLVTNHVMISKGSVPPLFS
jgi:hypothetical protein